MANKKWAAPGAVLLSLLFLLSAAIYNGFPLTYPDSGTYILSSLTLRVPFDRPIFYGLFIALSRLFGHTLWTAVALQAVILVLLLWLLIRDLGCNGWAFLAFLSGVLALTTGLPWFVGQLMPDVFAGFLAIALYILICGRRPLSSFARALVVLTFVASSLVHFANLLIAAGVIVVYGAASRFRATTAELRGRLWGAGALILTAGGFALATNAALMGRVFFSESSHMFLMSRLIDDRIIYRLLTERCKDHDYALCPYAETFKDLRGEAYAWDERSVVSKIGGWRGSGEASRRMILDSVRYYPGMHLSSLAKDSLRQLASLKIGEGLESKPDSSWVYQVIRKTYPGDFQYFVGSREQRSELLPLLSKADGLQKLVALLSFAAALALVLSGRSASDWTLYSLVFCGVNAVVFASTTPVFHRYQSRVAWLATLAVLLEAYISYNHPPGKVAERSKAHDWKSCRV